MGRTNPSSDRRCHRGLRGFEPLRYTIDAVALPAALRRLARALDGDAEAVRSVSESDADAIEVNGLLPAIGRLARTLGVDGPSTGAWRRRRLGASAHWMHLEQAMETAGATLAGAGVRWLPIKGCDVARRVYDAEEDRPTSDIDVLVAERDFEAGRTALESDGWTVLRDHPAIERYRREEGYAWQARKPGGPLLEIHFRLWGLIPAGFSDAVVADAVPDPILAGGFRPSLPDAYIIAAVHHWLNPAPRSLLGWWDLERIARAADPHGEDLVERIVERCDRFDLQAPLALSTAVAGSLWPRPAHRAISERLQPTLRRPELRLFQRLHRGGPDAVGLRALTLARLLAGRRSRGGWQVVPRQVWAHAGVVAQETPERWSWPRRRTTHVLRRLGLGRIAE